MTGRSHPTPFLRQLVPGRTAGQRDILFPLPPRMEIVLGRDPRCYVVLSSTEYGRVSRQHAKIVPVEGQPWAWQIQDLDSANGTFVNGQRIRGWRVLQSGDRIQLGQPGPEFIFDLQPDPSQSTAPNPTAISQTAAAYAATLRPGQVPAPYASQDDLTFSQLLPILSTGRDLTRKAYLIPGAITVGFVVLLFVAVGYPIWFNMLLATYLSLAAYYFVYQLCGKHKPWWLLVGVALTTMLLVASPVLTVFTFIFRGILPGDIPTMTSGENLLIALVQMFFGAGLMEELLKAVPLLLAYLVGRGLRSPLRERVGLWEPLDGILLGAASAIGFTLIETLGQYVPDLANNVPLQAGATSGDLMGLQLLIPRILGSIAGHIAYSGYFGYFIGLSVIRPTKRWRILTIGALTAAGLHTLWNISGMVSFAVLALVGITSYAFLGAAILKARALSPNRSENFATRFSGLK